MEYLATESVAFGAGVFMKHVTLCAIVLSAGLNSSLVMVKH